ncbi:hypothetical protein A9Q81_15700 [Gammaproteobacteria bacterium 42_54_T18]|nr:hypothetical protein A9Q81_15700 [Gammaproteobacteria bacterium 42_54_T18]
MPNENVTRKQLTLISFYGSKTDELHQLINSCIQKIQKSPLGELFRPYDINQIHGTIIGMEKVIKAHTFYNHNIAAETKNNVTMDFSHFLTTVHQNFPMTIQFGGFHPSFKEFTSAGQLPNTRTFQIQWINKKVTLLGWPSISGGVTNQLSNIRTSFLENCNISHKYKNDNDLFMVLGEISHPNSVSISEKLQLTLDTEQLEKSIRDYLYKHPIITALDLNALSIAQYTNPTLPITHTINHPLNKPGLTADCIRTLYS